MNNLPLSLFVREGEVISAKTWNEAMTFLLGCRLQAGRDTRLDSRPDGTTITFDSASNRWPHNFRCVLAPGDSGVQVRFGTVNGKVPRIAETPLDAATPRPLLWSTAPRLDADGRGWIAVEVTFDAQWGVQSAIIVQVANLDTDTGDVPKTAIGYWGGGTLTLPRLSKTTGPRARWPLAMLRRRDTGSLDLFQVTHFSLQHRVSIKPGETRGRHFFFAAA